MNKKLSLVVPVYYEEDVILQFLKETKIVFDKLPIVYEYIDNNIDRSVKRAGVIVYYSLVARPIKNPLEVLEIKTK